MKLEQIRKTYSMTVEGHNITFEVVATKSGSFTNWITWGYKLKLMRPSERKRFKKKVKLMLCAVEASLGVEMLE
jgi:hypothetical protein